MTGSAPECREISSLDLAALRAGCRRLYADVTPAAIADLVQMVSRDLTAVSDAIRAELAAECGGDK
jgi:hypothetical protein